MPCLRSSSEARRGAIAVKAAAFAIILMGMAGFSVDIGWIMLARNQLQVAADAAAMAAAGELGAGQTQAKNKAIALAAANYVGNESVVLADADVDFGNWTAGDSSANPPVVAAYTSSTVNGYTLGTNAVKVTAKKTGLKLFFGRVFGLETVDLQVSSIAKIQPRDIMFVIDLSGSMNNDSEIWCTQAINDKFPTYSNIGTQLMQKVFDDFGFGAYPGTTAHIGDVSGQSPATASPKSNRDYRYLVESYLSQSSISSTYKTAASSGSWNTAANKTKAYKWIIDKQLATLMPNAKPTPDSSNSTSLAFWTAYLNYMVDGSGTGNWWPNGVGSGDDHIYTGSNPYGDAWPTLDAATVSQPYANKVGYQTFVQFMMDAGWDEQKGGIYTPLSRLSTDCPRYTENDTTSAAYGLSFPPREQPTHGTRMAVLAALKQLKDQNANASSTHADYVGVIPFDVDSLGSDATKSVPLFNITDTTKYGAARTFVANMQAVGDGKNSTASENGLDEANTQLTNNGRDAANKYVIFLSDGIANIKRSSSTAITTFTSNNTGEWFGSGASYRYERNGALMQALKMQQKGWRVYSVGIGLGCDLTLMDSMARMAGTAVPDPDNPTGPKISPYAEGNPADYQDRLTDIFGTIVNTKVTKLVK